MMPVTPSVSLSPVRALSPRRWPAPWKAALCVSLIAVFWAARADEVQVAVAANFAAPFQQIATGFTNATGHQVIVVTGSTGKFHAQIRNGAPFAVLVAADDDTPARLMDEGLAVKGTSFTYAVGKLALWSARPGFVDAQGEVLKSARFAHLAIANPKLAPYGAAGMEVLHNLKLLDALADKIVQAENITQAHQFVATGNAEIGFVALSQLAIPGKPASGSWWLVPAQLHKPIRQNAVLLTAGAKQVAAVALLKHLQSDAAKAVIQSWGYGL